MVSRETICPKCRVAPRIGRKPYCRDCSRIYHRNYMNNRTRQLQGLRIENERLRAENAELKEWIFWEEVGEMSGFSVRIKPWPIEGNPKACRIWFAIGVQSFMIGNGVDLDFDDEETAQWHAKQLTTALSRLEGEGEKV